MKKILATILVLAMLACMSIPAFAAPTQPGAISITATYNKAADTTNRDAVVYDVNVAYDNTVFIYTANADTYVWNPTALDYTTKINGEGGRWNQDSATITVTNRSNADVAITASANNNFNVTASANCASAVGAGEGDTNAATTATLTVTPPASIAASATVTVTITLA